jgi:hypothetical protein
MAEKLSHNAKVILASEYNSREEELEHNIKMIEKDILVKEQEIDRLKTDLDIAKKYLKWHQAVPDSVIFS